MKINALMGAAVLGVSLGSIAERAHAQSNRLSASATSPVGSDQSITPSGSAVATAGGQQQVVGSRVTTTITSSAFAESRFGYGQVTNSIGALMVPTNDVFTTQIGGGQIVGESEFRDYVEFRWAEGFDDTQPIDITFTARVVIPTGDTIALSPNTTLTVNSIFNFSRQGGLLFEEGDFALNFFQTLPQIATTPDTQTSEWSVGNGTGFTINGGLNLNLGVGIGIYPNDPDRTVLSAQIGALAFWQFYIDVPEGVEMIADSQHDYTRRVIPATPSAAVLLAASLVATRRRR